MSRRGVLGTIAASTAAIGAASVLGAAPAAATTTLKPNSKLLVTLLGTNGGPPPIAQRFGIASALTVNGKTYVVDCGRGALSQYMRAGLSVPDLAGIFLTHLHADHLVDYFSFPLLAGGASGTSGFQRIGVWGPGPAGIPSALSSAPGPVPGLAETTALATRAYAASPTFFRSEGVSTGAGSDPSSWLTTHELMPPTEANAGPARTAPTMRPFHVMEDDNVKVTAILVPHGAVYPAYAYRFDTDHGSVVFSGDTAASANVVTLAQDADALVHEVINASALAGLGIPPALLEHIKAVHTDVTELGAIAANASVRALVTTHYAPGDPGVVSDGQWRALLSATAQKARYRGAMIVGRDLLSVPVHPKRRHR